MDEKKQTDWANILQVIGFLCFTGSIIGWWAKPEDHETQLVIGGVGLVMLTAGSIMFYRKRREKLDREAGPPAAP